MPFVLIHLEHFFPCETASVLTLLQSPSFRGESARALSLLSFSSKLLIFLSSPAHETARSAHQSLEIRVPGTWAQLACRRDGAAAPPQNQRRRRCFCVRCARLFHFCFSSHAFLHHAPSFPFPCCIRLPVTSPRSYGVSGADAGDAVASPVSHGDDSERTDVDASGDFSDAGDEGGHDAFDVPRNLHSAPAMRRTAASPMRFSFPDESFANSPSVLHPTPWHQHRL
jgi:hypothetical protein